LSLTLPPLKTRTEDIKPLINHYIVRICERRKIDIKGISPDFMEQLIRYAWPGNVRELINTLETAISGALNEDILFSRHIPDYIRIQTARAALKEGKKGSDGEPVNTSTAASMPTFKSYRKSATERVEREYLEKLIVLARGDVKTACRISHLSRSRFYELIKHHRIPLS
jgi:two-component system NtrC family response regulator